MKKFPVRACVLAILAVSQPALADLTNGNFENGLTGWTTNVAGSANAVTLATGASHPSAGAIQPSLTNDHYVYTSQNGPGYSILSQAFTVHSGVNKVFFDLAINNSAAAFYTPNSLTYSSGQNEQARFDILKPGSSVTTYNPADIIVTVYQTQVGDSRTQAWGTHQVDISSQLAQYAGQNVIFRFWQADNQGYFNLAIDNVNVGLSQIAQILSTLASATTTGNHPAFAAAGVIDNNTNLLTQFMSLAGNDAAISNAVSQTLPLLTGGQEVVLGNVTHSLNRIIQARQEGAQGRSSGDEFFGDKHFWFKPFGSWARQDNRNGVSGYSADTYGMVFGADAELSDTNRVGAALAYAHSNVDSNSAIAPQNSRVNSYQAIVYGSHSLDDVTDINFQADIGKHDTDGRRNILFMGSTASSNYDSWSGHLGAGIARTFELKPGTTLTPSVRTDYTILHAKSYIETGAGAFNLNVNGNTAHELIFGVDGKLTHAVNDKVTLTANLGGGVDVLNEQATITSAFAGAPTAAFTAKGLDPSPWLTRGGVGLVSKPNDRVEISARYDFEVRNSFDNQTA